MVLKARPSSASRKGLHVAGPAESARVPIEADEFAQLYRTFGEPIYRYCYHRLGSASAAEDATQQVFTKAFAGRRSSDVATARGWLFTIAHHVTVDSVRSWRPTISLEAAADLRSTDPSPEDQAITSDLTDRMRLAMRALTQEQRDVLDLRMSGVSIEESAHILKTSPGAVKQLQLRAVRRLRGLLEEPGSTTEHEA